ncbi:MAG: hypothetical protein ACQESE_02895 [Nanobdellota archaeon]
MRGCQHDNVEHVLENKVFGTPAISLLRDLRVGSNKTFQNEVKKRDSGGRIVTEAKLSELKESTKGDSADVQILNTLRSETRSEFEKSSGGRI